MRNKPAECEGCALYDKGAGFAGTEGTGSSKILVLGEALGKNEAQESLPFRPYAQAGSQLNQILKEAGLSRGELLIYNVINCQPPRDWLVGAPWEIGALEHCKVHWEKVVREFKPKVIVTLGDIATRTLTGWSGPKKTISYTRGYVFDTPYGLVLPSYHPSFIKRGKPNLVGVCVQDFLKAQQIAKNGWNPTQPHYLTVPTESEIELFYERCKAQPTSLIAFDIETDYSLTEDSEFTYHEEENEEEKEDRQERAEQRLIMVQFSAAPGSGMALAFIGSNVEWIKKILSLPNPKAGHNAWRFDMPNLQRAAITVAGTVHDTMWMFKHSQPDVSGHYNLQSVASFYGFPFPWKHMSGTDLNYYGCCDVDAVQQIMQHLPYEMKAKGVWDSYQRHIVDLEPGLSAMSRRGLPVNDTARLALKDTLEEALLACDAAMQAQVPPELLNCKPKNGYKRTPKDTTGMIEREFVVDDPKVLETSSFGLVTRWCRIEPFKASNQQVLRYIHHKNHPKQFHVKTGKETSDVRALERLIKKTGDPLYRAILDFRTTEKLISTYVDGWKPGSDGRVHPQFLYKPATGQLSSIGPNAQNPPAGKGKDLLKVKLAHDFRRIVEAPAGYKLVEFDFKSFHGMTMALEAQDPDYLRLARIDMHSFLTSYMVKEPARFDWPDDQLRDYLIYIKGKYKIIRDTQAKNAILGAQFGEGADGLFKRYWEFFKSVSEAQKILDLLDDLFPKVKKFKYAIMVKAHKQHRLLSKFGYNRWFWDVMRWDPRRQCMVRSEQAEQAIAFLPANDAFGHKKEVMLKLYEEGLDELYGLVNEVHDSLVFCCPTGRVDSCYRDVKQFMEKPSSVLVDPIIAPQGLAVEVEVSCGQNWAEMSEVKL